MFIQIFRHDIDSILALIPANITHIEEERTCISATIDSSTLHFKSSAKQTLCVSYSSSVPVDWSDRELVLALIHQLEELAERKGFKGLEIEAPERTPLIGLLILLGYTNQFGGKRTNGMEGKYARFFQNSREE